MLSVETRQYALLPTALTAGSAYSHRYRCQRVSGAQRYKFATGPWPTTPGGGGGGPHHHPPGRTPELMVASCEDLRTVSEQLGHSDVRLTLKVYVTPHRGVADSSPQPRLGSSYRRRR